VAPSLQHALQSGGVAMQSVVNITKPVFAFDATLIRRLVCGLLIAVNLFIGTVGAHAAEISVALASNVLPVQSDLSHLFEIQRGYHVETHTDFTGKQTERLMQATLSDIFLAADTPRPRKPVKLGVASKASEFVYAAAYPVLWRSAEMSLEDAGAILMNEQYKHPLIASLKICVLTLAADKKVAPES